MYELDVCNTSNISSEWRNTKGNPILISLKNILHVSHKNQSLRVTSRVPLCWSNITKKLSVLKHRLKLPWLNTLNLSFFACNASQGNTSSAPSSVWAHDLRSGMRRTAQSLKMKNLVRGGGIPALSGMGWALSHTTGWWGHTPHCAVWQAPASGTGLQTGRITCFLPCTLPQAFSSSPYLVCRTTEWERPWSAGFCGPVREYGKNSPGTKNPHNSHYVPFSSTLMLLSLT